MTKLSSNTQNIYTTEIKSVQICKAEDIWVSEKTAKKLYIFYKFSVYGFSARNHWDKKSLGNMAAQRLNTDVFTWGSL